VKIKKLTTEYINSAVRRHSKIILCLEIGYVKAYFIVCFCYSGLRGSGEEEDRKRGTIGEEADGALSQ